MKKVFITLTLATFILSACQHGGDAKQKQLEGLKKQMGEIQGKIAALEAEIALSDTSKGNEKAKTVGITKLKAQEFTNYITVQGKVDADENVTLSPEMGGDVLRILVHAGDEVHKGQLLAELDGKVIQQGMAELQTALDLATTMYNKQKNLWDEKVGTEMQYLTAKNQKEGLERKMSTLQQQLELTRLKSPIDGTVDEVFLKLGQLAAPGFPAIRIVNFNHLKIKAEVPENYATKVKKGNPSVVLFPDINDSIMASLSFSAKVINAMNRTFNVEIDLENNREYRPNMIAILKIVDYTTKGAMVVPVGTVQHGEEGTFVYVANNGKAHKVKVNVGHEYNGLAEITSGLKEGDDVVTLGYQELNEGELLKF